MRREAASASPLDVDEGTRVSQHWARAAGGVLASRPPQLRDGTDPRGRASSQGIQ